MRRNLNSESSPQGDVGDSVAMDVEPDVQQESKAEARQSSHSSPEKEEIPQSASMTAEEEEIKNTGAEPASPDGWHTFPPVPRNKASIVILHNGGTEWLEEHKEGFAPGIRGPEGYIWAELPEDLLWAECWPHYMTRISISQLRLLSPSLLLEIEKEEGQEGQGDAKPILLVEGDNNRQQVLERLCGKPTIIPSIPYDVSGFLYELRGPDRLNVHIPFNELPSTLDVFDEDDVTNPGTHDHHDDDDEDSRGTNFIPSAKNPVLLVSPEARPIKYRLVDPTGKHTTKKAEDQATHATLVVSESRRIGAGHSARVYEGQIGLEIKKPRVREDQPPSMKFPPKLRVIAKVGTGLEDNEFMQNEAKMYHSFPEHFSREYTGFQIVKPSHFPHRLSQLVPYFYGFYEPVEEKIEGSEYRRAPIILMEDCGKPINPSALTQYQKVEIVSMIHRMHEGGFAHHSLAPRNILVQPGPLESYLGLNNCPEWSRSSRTPSFRLVDFGRSKALFKTTGTNSSQEKIPGFTHMALIDITQLGDAIQMRDIPNLVYN